MSDPRVGVFAYGSLLHPSELEQTFPSSHDDAIPVWIDGYRRCFNQRSSFREGRNGERGVLNLVEDDNARTNGVLVPDISDEAHGNYVDRESGYEVVELSPDIVTPYDDGQAVEVDKIITTVGHDRLGNPHPIPSYAALSVTGATLWGDQFLTDFLVTTDRD